MRAGRNTLDIGTADSPGYHRRYAHTERCKARAARQYERHKVRLASARAGGCVRCGSHEDLHHHHIDPGTKRCKVSAMVTYSDQAFWDEVGKCEVLCQPCHKAHHYA